MQDEIVSFGHWLRRRRKALDLTQDALAALVSCSVTTIRKLEADERRPSRQLAELLANALAIDGKDRALFLQVARAERNSEQLQTIAPAPTNPTTAPPPAPVLTPPQPPLPATLTPLVGRSLELEQIATLLDEPTCRLLTLVGPGGIGKTRLAVATIQNPLFADVRCFVALAAVSTPEFLTTSIAQSLGLALSGSNDPQAQLLNYLREKRLLLVLDNFEHLLAGAALVTEVLQAAAQVKVLVTSRERLNIQGEWVLEVQGLPVPAGEQSASSGHSLEAYSAVALFVQRARQVRAGFALSAQNQQQVVQICRLVEGMPLGIELAAAWVHLLSCQEIAQEIERTIDFLATNRRDVPPRHRSLRAAFDHSWQLLTEEEQQVLRHLAVFQGGFTREAAEQVAAATLPLLAALAAKSLLHRGETGRYELHELVRQYAYDWLRTNHEEALVRSRHCAYYQQLAEAAFLPLRTAEQTIWVKRLAAEYGNLRAALAWTLTDKTNVTAITAGLRMGGALWLFWWLGEHWREGATWLEQLLAVRVVSASPGEQLAYQQARARALIGAAILALDRLEPAYALACAEESLPLCRQVDDAWGVAFALFLLGVLGLTEIGNVQQAPAYCQESVTRFRQLDDKRCLSLPLEILGHFARRSGDHQTAVALWEEALQLNRLSGDPTGIAQASDRMAQVWLRQGEYARAQTLLAESLAVYHQLGNRFGAAYALYYLGRIAHVQHNYAQARAHYAASQAIFQEFGSKEASVLIEQGRLLLDEGDLATAHPLLVHSLALAQEGGIAEHLFHGRMALAQSWLAQKQYAEARALFATCLTNAQATHDHDALGAICVGFAQLALAQGEPTRAAQLLGAAQVLWEQIGLPPAPNAQPGYAQCLDTARNHLGETAFRTAWSAGQQQAMGEGEVSKLLTLIAT